MKLNRPSEDSTTKDKAHSAQGDVNDRTTDVEGKSETSDRVSTRTSAIKKTGERGMDPSHVTKEELRLKRSRFQYVSSRGIRPLSMFVSVARLASRKCHAS